VPISLLSAQSFLSLPSSLFFMLLILLVPLIIIAAIILAAKRKKEWQLFASRHGLSFSRRDPFSTHKSLRHFDLFSHGHSRRAYNVCFGTIRGMNIRAFDYKYTVGSGKNSHTYYFTALIVRANMTFDRLFIRPERFFDKVAAAVGFDDVDFESAEFSRKFFVKAENKKFAYDVIHPRTMEFLLSCQTLNVETNASNLLFHHGKKLPVPEVDALLDNAEQFISLIPQYLRNDRTTGVKTLH
jgi:hypothetical protein